MDKSSINPTTGKAWAVNPATGQWDDNYFANQVEPKFRSSNNSQTPIQGAISSLTPQSVTQSAQQLNDFYKQQNQPVIQSYEASKAPLQQRYKDLLDSIKGNQQVAENRTTLATNNELGRRGISNKSGIYEQEMAQSLNPITQQYTGMLKDTTNQQNIDLAAIDKAIAQLNAGNPESSVSTALGLNNAQQSANQFAQQLALQQDAQRFNQDQAMKQENRQSQSDSINNALAQLQLQFGMQSNPLQLQLLQSQVNKAKQPSFDNSGW